MNLLLDTHALLWWLGNESTLSPDAEVAIANPENTVFLSAVVVWEIRIKEALGKLRIPANFESVLGDQDLVELPMGVEHAHRIGRLPMIHRDPFDRMLVAQALVEKLTIVTRDESIAAYDVRTIPA